MKLKDRKAILITGPAGSGKTSLAERIAQNENWIHVSEDLHWIEIKKGHPAGEYRTPEEQRIVQPAVVLQIRDLLSKGKSVVLEFINYENPPKPLIYYYEELGKVQCNILVKVLRPSEQVIMTRKQIRGRADDQDYEEELKNTRHQLACLESSYIEDEWIIDNSEMTVEEVYARCFLGFVEENA
jgi:adenylate kinase family enzyme